MHSMANNSTGIITFVTCSAGDNILNLLLDEPRQIGIIISQSAMITDSFLVAHDYNSLSFAVAVDLLPTKNALLEFKIAAIKHLNYEEFLIILGDKEGSPQMR